MCAAVTFDLCFPATAASAAAEAALGGGGGGGMGGIERIPRIAEASTEYAEEVRACLPEWVWTAHAHG